RRAVDVRAARVRQPEQPADLVERLAGGVVEGLTELGDVGGDVAHVQQRRVPAGDDQPEEGLGERPVHQRVDGDVADDVVDAVERDVETERERLRGGDADRQRAAQAGTGGDGDRVDVGQLDLGLRERGVERGPERLQVRARGDLGDDAAEAGVVVHRGRGDVGEQVEPADQGDTGLVAGALDP